MRRLVIPRGCIENDRARITGPHHHYLSRVLRLKKGAALALVDGEGQRYTARVATISGHDLTAIIEVIHDPTPGPRPRVTLIHGLSRRSRTEMVLQKATELGVDWIIPALCQRSVSRPSDPARKLQRWIEILRQAARQCGRDTVPLLSPPIPFEQAAAETRGHDLRLIGTLEGAAVSCVEDRLAALGGAVVLAVGPEGGFTPEEQSLAVSDQFEPVRLGDSTLRTETAAIALLSVVMFITGRFGRQTRDST